MTTVVSAVRPMPGRNFDSGAREKVVKRTCEERRRSVRETFAAAAAPNAAEIPGMTSKSILALRRALMVRSSGSPGPAPIRKTLAVFMGCGGAEEKLSSVAKAHLSIGFTPG